MKNKRVREEESEKSSSLILYVKTVESTFLFIYYIHIIHRKEVILWHQVPIAAQLWAAVVI